ncbi:hypothetical protein ABTI66_09275, partial [Acinetobacter baumannii]
RSPAPLMQVNCSDKVQQGDLIRPTCGIAQSSLRIAFQSRVETLPLPRQRIVSTQKNQYNT